MTEDAPFRASMCPEDGCHALVPSEYRVRHADGHTSAKKSARAFRARLTQIDHTLAEVKDDHRILMRKFEQISTEPDLAVEPWPEDERATPEDDDIDPDEDPGLEGQELEDDDEQTANTFIPFPRAAAPIDPSLPTVNPFAAIDRDDDYTTPVA